jgi:hypothetical protein
MLLGRDQDTAYLISRVHVLLDIAGLRGSSGEVSKSALDNLSISNPGFRRFLSDLAAASSTSQLETQDSTASIIKSSGRRLLQIEALWKEQDLVAKTTRSIESKLLYPDFSQGFRESMASHIGSTAANNVVELNEEIMDLLSRLPRSDRAEQAITECKIFEDTSHLRFGSTLVESGSSVVEGGDSVVEKMQMSRRTMTNEQAGDTSVLLQDDGPDMLSKRKKIAVKRVNAAERKLQATPARLTAWPVTDQHAGYLERASFG